MRVGAEHPPYYFFRQPAADGSIVPAVEVVLEAGVGVEGPTGEEEQRVRGRIARGRHPAKGAVDEVVDHGGHITARVGLGNVPERIELVHWHVLYRSAVRLSLSYLSLPLVPNSGALYRSVAGCA